MSHEEHNYGVTPKRAFWEAFATVCLPSLVLWTVFACFLTLKLNLPVGEALPFYLLFAVLPMPLAFPIYRRYLRGSPQHEVMSPRASIALAILFAVVGTMHASQIPHLLRTHQDVWDVVFHGAITTVWLFMSIRYLRRAITKQHPGV